MEGLSDGHYEYKNELVSFVINVYETNLPDEIERHLVAITPPNTFMQSDPETGDVVMWHMPGRSSPRTINISGLRPDDESEEYLEL